MDGKHSRWRLQKNGLSQGSVLAPKLFNIYTNDQSEFDNIWRFIYADDLCIATKAKDFAAIHRRSPQESARRTIRVLQKMVPQCQHRKDPSMCFPPEQPLGKHSLNIKWGNEDIESNNSPVYLGATLDRTLSFNNMWRS